jgi:CubicO group peptidase (beta-lactamase class C family)
LHYKVIAVPKIRMKTVLALAAVAVGLVLTAIAGLWIYVSATATPLHPSAQSIQSVARAEPSAKWADAVGRARQIARAGLTAQNLPGLSVAVGVGGEIIWAEGLGWADLETHAPVAPEMRFRTGGVSMALTSIIVGLLLEKNRLRLDDEIQKYVPTFPKKPWPVTLRQLMGHQAGIRVDGGDEEPLSERCAQTIDALPRFAERPLLFEPGTQFRYTTYGWILVSAAVEAVADQPFLRVMRDEVFRPLELNDTEPDSPTKPPPNLATFYYPRFAGDTRYGPEEARPGDYACFAGAGAFLSTPSDLVRFGIAINGGKLLQPATVKMLQASQRLASGAETGYGLGWDLETMSLAGQSTREVGHDGEYFIGGSTSLITFPERGIVVAVMTNTSFADTKTIALNLAQAFAPR